MYPEQIEVKVKIKAPIYSTEGQDRIENCLDQIFPRAVWDIKDEEIVGESDSLEKFAEIIEDMKIRDTARSFLKPRITGDKCSFTLSKQASCKGKINFSDEDQPLGGIDVVIESRQIEKLIKKITGI